MRAQGGAAAVGAGVVGRGAHRCEATHRLSQPLCTRTLTLPSLFPAPTPPAVFSTRTNKLEIDIAAVEAKQAEIAALRKRMVGAPACSLNSLRWCARPPGRPHSELWA